MERKEGAIYYYINSYLVPECGKDTNSSLDDMRYEAGNYFKTYQDAFEMCLKIRKLLSK